MEILGCGLAVLFMIVTVVACYAASYFIVAGLTWLVCLGFGFEWSWLLALGVWAACLILRWIFEAANGKTKE